MSHSPPSRIFGFCALIAALVALFLFGLLHRQRDMESMLALARRDYPDVPRIQVADLQQWLADSSRPKPQLFDVRTPEEYAVSCLPGAQRIDPNVRIKTARALIDPKRTSVFYCSIGYRSSALVSALRDGGITNIANLEGSIFAWANAGLPLEDPSTHSPTRLVHPYSDSYAPLLKPGLAAKVPLLQNAGNEIAMRQRLRMGFALALLVTFLVWETFAPMYTWFKNRPAARIEHGSRNIILGLLNTLIVAFLFVNSWLWASNWAHDHSVGFLNFTPLPSWLHGALALFILDAWMYSWHRLNHGIPFLWRFHRVHHSEPHLDVTSATRFHLGEIALSAILRIPLILFFGIRFYEIVLYESMLFAVVQFHHANIKLPQAFERALSLLIVTPNFHRVHHSQFRPETDSNFSSLLSFWDRAFGTHNHAADPAKLQLGLPEFGEDSQSLGAMLKTPLC